MTQNIQILIRSIFSLAFVILVFGTYVVSAQESLTGDWRAAVSAKNADRIYLTFNRNLPKNAVIQIPLQYRYESLQGLTREQSLATEAVKFSLISEAGTIECEGGFERGRGAGTFRFTANPDFVSAMKSRGFKFDLYEKYNGDGEEAESSLFAAARLNITTALADDLLRANLGELDTGNLYEAASFKLDSTFVREMKALNFQNLNVRGLVRAKNFKVDAGYVRSIRESGFTKANLEDMIKLRTSKVTPEYIKELQAEGLTNLSIDELVKLKKFKISGEFIRYAKANGNAHPTVGNLVQMRNMGIVK